MPRYTDEEHPGIERFESGVVGNYVKQQELDIQAEAEAVGLERELAEERQWAERYADESIPEWMDEEAISARAYEREDEGLGPYDLPDWEEKEHQIRIKAW